MLTTEPECTEVESEIIHSYSSLNAVNNENNYNLERNSNARSISTEFNQCYWRGCTLIELLMYYQINQISAPHSFGSENLVPSKKLTPSEASSASKLCKKPWLLLLMRFLRLRLLASAFKVALQRVERVERVLKRRERVRRQAGRARATGSRSPAQRLRARF